MTEAQQNKYLEAMTSALEYENGIKIKFPSYDDARRFQRMCYMLRSRLRAKRAKGLPIEQVYKASTEYDVLSFAIIPESNEYFLHISKPPKMEFIPI